MVSYFIFELGTTAAQCYGDYSWAAAGTETILVYGAQNEEGSRPSSYCEVSTGGVTTTRALDVYTFSNPLVGYNPTMWTIASTLTPLSSWLNILNAGGGVPLWFQLGTQTFANSSRGDTSATEFDFDVWDGAAAELTVTSSAVLSGSAPVSVSYQNAGGVLTIKPGTTGSPSGAGTGKISTQPATITLGLGTAPYNFQGWFKNFYINQSTQFSPAELTLFTSGVPSSAIGATSLKTAQGAVVSNTRATPAFCDISPGNDASIMQLQSPTTVRVEANGLLTEGATTNYIVYSQLIGYYDGVLGWQQINGGSAGATVVTTNSPDVFGPRRYSNRVEGDFPQRPQRRGFYSFTSEGWGGNPGTISVWLRTLTGTATVYLATNGGAGTPVTCNVTTTWQRFTNSNGSSGGIYYILGADTRVANGATPGITACTVYAWGAQAESTAFPTSYFPTGTNTLTNSALDGRHWLDG